MRANSPSWAGTSQWLEKSQWWVTTWEGNISSNLLPVVSITEVSNCLLLLKIPWLNIWENIEPTGQFWSTCGRVFAASWWSRVQSNKTAILWGRERRYGELTLFTYVYFTVFPSASRIVTRSVPESAHIFNTIFGTNQCPLDSPLPRFGYWLRTDITHNTWYYIVIFQK